MTIMQQNPYQLGPVEASAAHDDQGRGKTFDAVEYEIKKQATNAMVTGVLSVFMIFFIPVALIYGRQAIKLIESKGKGQQYYKRPKRGMTLAYIAAAFVGLVFLVVLGGIVVGVIIGTPS